MGMTARQRAFLEQFWDLYREVKAPLHYSAVAKKLKISNISAYDMLRLLKRQGMVASQYLLPKKQPGPGRSTIVFYPTRRAAALIGPTLADEAERREWELYSTEMVTAIVLQMCQLREEARARLLKEARKLILTGESGLSALAGLPLGLTLVEEANRSFTNNLLSCVERYQEHLTRLSAESKEALSDFFLEVVKAVEGEKA
jgi:energy-coupling factor transport system substrate-specific component